ncbi:hypothetical protein [Daejeonella sp.]|uniref:hypothetical protein n=1 Tax=Daejeonella sp. TaxID=2805397 RepID=UPI0030BF0459
MQHEIVLSGNGSKYVLQLISSSLKSLRVWKVRFQDGAEAVLIKVGNEWLQRNEDNLDHWLIKAIGEKIDQINPQVSFS